MNYVKIWETYNKKSLPAGYEIHHIDGNHSNNNPENLLAVTIKEHLEIHFNQGDHGAVQAILMRIERNEEMQALIRESARKVQLSLLEQGKHNFQKIGIEKRKEISSKGLKTKELNIGIHAINSDPVLSKENARRGGLKAAEKRAGFLNTLSINHGSKYVKGSKWWTHENGNRVRSIECPGEGWKRGMKNES